MCPNISRGSSGHRAHRERLGLGGEASLASPAKNARGVETCSAWGVDGGGDRSTVPLWLTRWMRAYGSYGSCVVATLATSYGQLATITRLRMAVLGQKQHLVK